MKIKVYADNAATTKMSGKTVEVIKEYLEEYANPSSVYLSGTRTKKLIEGAREKIANLIGAKSNEIYFTSGGTESDNWALKGIAFNYPGERKRIITSSTEHHAILRSAEFLEKLGYDIVHLPVDKFGVVNPKVLENAIDENTILVSIAFANNEIGTIEPIRELTSSAHKYNVLFHTDAVQAMGHIPINVNDLGVDMLSASAHKFGGSKGIGFLYIREGIKITPLHHGGAQEFGIRAGTENVAAILGMAAALEESVTNIDVNAQKLNQLERIIIDGLDEDKIEYKKNGNNIKLPGLLSLSFKNKDGEKLLHRLDLAGICVSTGSACNSKETEISHVLQAINLDEAYAKGTIRISLGKDNDEKQAKYILEQIKNSVV